LFARHANNNPIKFTDPSGQFFNLGAAVVGAVGGAIIGAAFSVGTQMVQNYVNNQPLTANLNPTEIARSAAVGAGTGFLGGLTMGGSLVATVATGAITGAAGGQVEKAINNAFEGKSIGEGLFQPGDMLKDAALGSLGATGGYAANKLGGAILSKIKGAGEGINCNSFSGDTLVLTYDGYKPIAWIQVGDWVLGWDEDLGAVGFFTVTASWHHEDPLIVHVYIDGESIEATPEHPFFVPGVGWREAGKLWPGAPVRKADGGVGIVAAVESVALEQPMWNLTVAEAHTYFVGESQWLVHNGSCELIAKDVAGVLDDRAQRHRTVGVAFGTNEAGDSADFVASSGGPLTKAQKARVTELGANAAPGKKGVHGEISAISAAEKAGFKVDAVGASRPMCLGCTIATWRRGAAQETSTQAKAFPLWLVLRWIIRKDLQ
jgi:hypothetical protein